MDIMRRDMGGWDTLYSSHKEVFQADHCEAGRQLIERWVPCFAAENTWAQRVLRVPSIIARLDCTVVDKRLCVYEIEERPAGIGSNIVINEEFVHLFREVERTWPIFDVIVSDERHGSDDYLWASANASQAGTNLVLVRAEPSEVQFHHLESVSVSSLKKKGCKKYGVQLGMWDLVTSEAPLSWDTGFVLKPIQGSKTRGIEIWDPRKRQGSVTKTRIARRLAEEGHMYCQPFYLPIETQFPDYPWMIYRVCYGFNIETRQWVCLGGEWNARPNMKIHGAKDTLCGPLVLTN